MGIPKGSKARLGESPAIPLVAEPIPLSTELEGEGDEGLGARGEGRGCWVEALG